MLPKDLASIVEDYIADIHQLENLPEVRSVRRLALKSDRFLIHNANVLFEVPTHVLIEIVHLEQHHSTFFVDTDIVNKLHHLLVLAMNTNMATSSLFWLFIIREPNLYFGAYSTVFESSLLFKLLNIVTSV